MSVVYLLGNGFDLNLGLKTSYASFLESYAQSDSKTPKIAEFKANISKNILLWSDLERALGSYTQYIANSTEFDSIFEDISDDLKHYLLEIENGLRETPEIPSLPASDFLKLLAEPENNLSADLGRNVTRLLGDVISRRLDIVSFNYTRTVQILYPELNINIHHVHGHLGQDIVIGVNDDSQISNGGLRKSLDVTEALIKSECNTVMQRTDHISSMKVIKSAKVVCLFGLSLGTTDKIWWDLIAKEVMSRNLTVILFWKSKDGELNKDYKIKRVHRHVKNKLAQGTSAQTSEQFDKNVHIIVDSEIFSKII